MRVITEIGNAQLPLLKRVSPNGAARWGLGGSEGASCAGTLLTQPSPLCADSRQSVTRSLKRAGAVSTFCGEALGVQSTMTRPPTDGVDGPLTASRCQNGGRQRSPATGAIHGRYYNHWS
jgi:hypothetical protein